MLNEKVFASLILHQLLAPPACDIINKWYYKQIISGTSPTFFESSDKNCPLLHKCI